MRHPAIACTLVTILLTATACLEVQMKGQPEAPTAGPAKLKCEYRVNPLGVDLPNPRLEWIVNAESPKARGVRQAAYRILVASSADALAKDQGDLWDSGKVQSSDMNQIAYSGKALASAEECFWKVRTWDQDGKESPWSATAKWTMGLLNAGDWKGKWIAKAESSSPQAKDVSTLLIRREFAVKPGLTRALAFVCGLGDCELSLNGKKVGDDLLGTGWSKYDKTCLYDTRDLTTLLKEGTNVIGLELSSSMYNVPKMPDRFTKLTGVFGPLKAIGQIQLEYADGTSETISTDESWKLSPGPTYFSHVFSGEDFDARQIQVGWDAPGFDASKWTVASISQAPGDGKAVLRGVSCSAPPIRTFDVFKPIQTKRLNPTTQVADLGQNASMMPRIKVTGPAGSIVRISPSELLAEKNDGSIDPDSTGSKARRGFKYWQYTLAGTPGGETWAPKFFYHGLRYLELYCIPAPGSETLPTVESVEGVVVHSSSPAVGTFETSSDLFNRIHTLVRWAQRSNMMSLMTDCPHREKLGWLEEDHLNGPALRYNYDLAALFTKQCNDMSDSQLENGLVPNIAPEFTIFQTNGVRNSFADSPEWSSSALLVPWQQYEFDGDVALLRLHYDMMKRYVGYLKSKSKDNIVSHGLGDWYDIGPKAPGVAQNTPVPLTATAFYYYDTMVLAKIAALIGKPDEAKALEKSAAEIKEAFNREFYKADTHNYATGSQCANSLALYLGLVDEKDRAAVLENVVKDVREKGLTAGDVGYRYLLRALADGGRSDVIFEINNQSEKPGYGYQLKMGATSLTEAWNARRGGSQNHFMLGQITEWFYHDLAGIQCDPAGPGFRKIIIRPAIVGDLKWVKAGFDSRSGRIESGWKRENGKISLDITIPANTSATVYVRAKSQDAVTESGQSLGKSEGVKFLRAEGNTVVCEVPSGMYHFEAKE